jgi:NADPH-dependent glutamate synthase beta subunit-like oxidoreductase/ferredoxin
VGTDAGAYVTAIADGDWASAYAYARAHNPFPSVCGRVCAAPCETACRRGIIDAPVAIRALKRTATERFGVESALGPAAWHTAHGPVPPATRPPVAIVGAGPAGLAAAYELRLAGHAVVIHEASDRAGGMMALGIPAFRLPRALLDGEIAAILDLGIDLRLGSAVGRDVSIEALLTEHAAVFVASGCGRGRELDIPGRERQGVILAVEYLLHVNQGAPPPVGERVAVIGGGSVAFDVARTARRITEPSGDAPPASLHTSLDAARSARRAGSREVTIFALESREELPTDEAELAAAETEGIHIRFRHAVTRIDGEARVRGIAVAPVRRVFDDRGHFAPEVEHTAEERLEADTVIVAIGQRAETGFVASTLVPERTGFGGLPVDASNQRTTHPRLWAGGDVARGPRLLIEAVADGQRAARDIIRVLAGETRRPAEAVTVLSPAALTGRWHTGYDRVPRIDIPLLAPEHRTDFAEAEHGLAADAARREGARCLRCFEQVMLDADRCIVCGLCVDVCPEGCLSIEPGPDTAGGAWRFALDETACLRCGLCVARCPAEALSLVHAAEACARTRAEEGS